MSTSTTRLGLTKPSGSAAPEEAVDIGVINTNMNLIDQWMGCILVNDGITPATGDLFDGAIVKERTSGIIWEARKNGGGTFDKVYVRYPLVMHGYTQNTVLGSGTSHTVAGIAAVDAARCKNTSLAHVTGGRYVIPVKGIYNIRISTDWAFNATGQRSLALELDSAVLTTGYESITPANSVFPTRTSINVTFLLNVSQTIAAAVWQNSGGNLNMDQVLLQIMLVEPVQ